MSDNSTAKWFAEFDKSDMAYPWQPTVQTPGGYFARLDVWFATEAECEEWIETELGWSVT